MFNLHVKGNTPTAWAFYQACEQAGIGNLKIDAPSMDASLTYAESAPAVHQGAVILPPNLTKVLVALGHADKLKSQATIPDRNQIRFGKSAYLLSELPLGNFFQERYNAALYNIEQADLLRIL